MWVSYVVQYFLSRWRVNVTNTNLIRKSSNSRRPNALIMMSANCDFVETCFVAIRPLMISSRKKWQSIPICLVRAWYTGLAARSIADKLSGWNGIGPEQSIPNAGRSSRIHNCVCHCHVFGFRRRTRDAILFHCFPRKGEPPSCMN